MVIDFHTHSFPDELADRAVGRLAQSGGIHNYLDGRVTSIQKSMKRRELIILSCCQSQRSQASTQLSTT